MNGLAQDNGWEKPLFTSNATQQWKIAELGRHLKALLKIEPVIDGPQDSATYCADVNIPKALGIESVKLNPLIRDCDPIAAVRISNYGNLATLNGAENLEPDMQKAIVEAIDAVGLLYIPRDLADLESRFAGETWVDLFFREI